jgi:hypothetical protein
MQKKDGVKFFASSERLKDGIRELSQTDLEYQEFSWRILARMSTDLNVIQKRMRDYLVGRNWKSTLIKWVPVSLAGLLVGGLILHGSRFYNYMTSLFGKIPSLWSVPVVPAESPVPSEVSDASSPRDDRELKRRGGTFVIETKVAVA